MDEHTRRGLDAQREEPRRSGAAIADDEVSSVALHLATEGLYNFWLSLNAATLLTGAQGSVTPTNAAAIMIKAAVDLMRTRDRALALEFVEVTAECLRTLNSGEEAACERHLQAMRRLGGLLTEFAEIEMRQSEERQEARK